MAKLGRYGFEPSFELKFFLGIASTLLIVWVFAAYLSNGDIQATTNIVQALTIFGGGSFALFRYIKHRNDEVDLKVLNEVYAPLYAFIVKNDTLCYVIHSDQVDKYMPFLNVSHRKTTTNFNINNGECNFSQKEGERKPANGMSIEADLLSVSEKVNIGLAPYELVTLLNMYKTVCFLTKDLKHKSKQLPSLVYSNEQEARRWVFRHRVELALRKSIIKGYIKYSKKVEENYSNQNLFELSNEWLLIKKHDSKDRDAFLERFKNFASIDHGKK